MISGIDWFLLLTRLNLGMSVALRNTIAIPKNDFIKCYMKPGLMKAICRLNNCVVSDVAKMSSLSFTFVSVAHNSTTWLDYVNSTMVIDCIELWIYV